MSCFKHLGNSVCIFGLLVGSLFLFNANLFALEPASADSPKQSAEVQSGRVRDAIDRSVALLSREVPKWVTDHQCASCHNQGDATVALIEASRRNTIDQTVLQSTLQWLGSPDIWESNRGLPEASDQKLANLQFSAALLAAFQTDNSKYQLAINAAATLLTRDQADDGSWNIESGGSLASPITHGQILLTGNAIKVLQASQLPDRNDRIARAQKFLEQQQPRNTLEASSMILALPKESNARHQMVENCTELVLASQDESSGGWGPHRNAAPENFDTALAILGLVASENDSPKVVEAIASGTQYLLDEQSEDGSWYETTRPSGTNSYAHRISTTAWVCRALLAASEPDR